MSEVTYTKLYLPKYAVLERPIRECNTVCESAKIYFGELVALSDKRGHVPYTDAQLAEVKGKTTKCLEVWHRQLEKAGFIKRVCQNKLQDGEACKWKKTRRIYVDQNAGFKKCSDTLKKEGSDDTLKKEGISEITNKEEEEGFPKIERTLSEREIKLYTKITGNPLYQLLSNGSVWDAIVQYGDSIVKDAVNNLFKNNPSLQNRKVPVNMKSPTAIFQSECHKEKQRRLNGKPENAS